MPSKEEFQQQARKKANELRKLASAAEAAAGIAPVRNRAANLSSDAARKANKRAQERDLAIPKIKEPNRRADCLADVKLFHKTYFPAVFYQPFTLDREEVIKAIEHCCRFGGDQSVAGPRGDGKTRNALFTSWQLMMAGALCFPMIISKAGDRAFRELQNLKDGIEDSRLFLEDFPEVAFPIKSLGRWASKARQQTAYGELTNMEWASDVIVLPTIPSEVLWKNGWNEGIESAARGQIMASLGWEGPIRGYTVRNKRPDLAIIDDIDDRESARSETLTTTRILVIEEDIAGLGGPDRRVSRVLLGTLLNNTCVAAQFTDQAKHAGWRPKRLRMLAVYPGERGMLKWAEYIELRRFRSADDPDARVAHQLYLDHREIMDEGAKVTNPYRFDGRLLRDGSQLEVSALQACFNIIADTNQDHFDTEYQNDPPKELGLVEKKINVARICNQFSGVGKCTVPQGCKWITVGVDVGMYEVHYVVRAWKGDGTGYTIDYGYADVIGTDKHVDAETTDLAVLKAVRRLLRKLVDTEYEDEAGQIFTAAKILVDSRWRQESVYSACLDFDPKTVQPCIGHGRSDGCAKPNFADVLRRSKDRKPGYHVFETRQSNGLWLVNVDADFWKNYEQDRWLSEPNEPGCLFIFGYADSGDDRQHRKYGQHICNEIEGEHTNDKGIKKRKWTYKGPNHWLDSSAYSDAGGGMLGVRVMKTGVLIAPPPAKWEGWGSADGDDTSPRRGGRRQ